MLESVKSYKNTQFQAAIALKRRSNVQNDSYKNKRLD